MCLASWYGAERLDRIEDACDRGGDAWKNETAAYAAFVSDLAERWAATAE